MKTYRQLFAIREFQALFLVQCLNIGSYAVASLALGTITFAATGSPVLTALAMFGARAPCGSYDGDCRERERERERERRSTASAPTSCGRERRSWSSPAPPLVTDLLQALPPEFLESLSLVAARARSEPLQITTPRPSARGELMALVSASRRERLYHLACAPSR